MEYAANLTVHERYGSPNGGLPSCLENLAHWLASDGRDKVLALLEEDYEKADHKRIQDCLCFLIDGITHLDQDVVVKHVDAIQALVPDLQGSNASYNAKAIRSKLLPMTGKRPRQKRRIYWRSGDAGCPKANNCASAGYRLTIPFGSFVTGDYIWAGFYH